MTDPTPDDLARDAERDLAICAEATPPPWSIAQHATGHLAVMGPYSKERNSVAKVFCEFDAAFMVLARTALPYWIDRAIAAEREVNRLREQLSRFAHTEELT